MPSASRAQRERPRSMPEQRWALIRLALGTVQVFGAAVISAAARLERGDYGVSRRSSLHLFRDLGERDPLRLASGFEVRGGEHSGDHLDCHCRLDRPVVLAIQGHEGGVSRDYNRGGSALDGASRRGVC